MTAGHARSTTQPFREVADYLRARIMTGELPAGSRLPSARELAEERGVALTTAVRAVAELRNEGLVDTVHGRGSYVCVPLPELIRRGDNRYRRHPEGLAPNRDEADLGGYLDEVDRGERSTTPATPALAERLHVEVGAPLSVVRYRWLAAGRPTQISTQWEPLALTAGTPAEQPAAATRGQRDVIARFDAIGLRVTHVIEDVRARMPSWDEQVDLELATGIPVLAITRTHWADDIAIETADIVIRSDRTLIRTCHTVKD